MTQRKRSRDDSDDNHIGVGETLASINGQHDGDEGGGWQQAESRRTKRLKKAPSKEKNNYPEIKHAPSARLQTFVKLSDLQNLVLYLIADGTAPQWVSVRNHGAVKKVVVLMVPGLEAALFDGSIPLDEATTNAKDAGKTDSQGDPIEDKAAEFENGVKGTSEKVGSEAPEDMEPQPRKLHISPDDYYPVRLKHSRLPGPLRPLSDLFEHIWPVKTPGDDKYAKMHSPLAAMLTSPIVKTKEDKNKKGPKPPAESRNWQNKRTPITEFLTSTQDLSDEGYVLHPAHYNGTPSAVNEEESRKVNKTAAIDGWVDTANIPNLDAGTVPEKDIENGAMLEGRRVLAMDCEMCITSPKGATPQVFSLTRVSVIDWDGNVVLDELVKPADPITDYLTPYSGITEKMLENVSTTLSDVQQKLLALLTPQTILIGHSLNSDLNALRLTHPYIIDTSLIFPHPRGPPLKSSLKWLAQKYLSREIQKGHGATGHNSIEDAKACLDLVKQKIEKGKAWGTAEASSESIFKRLARCFRPKRDKVNPIGDDEPRISAVVDWGDPARGYGGQAQVPIGCSSDAEVVAGVRRAINGDPDSALVPKGGCDFTWARLRELEAHRGWWDRSKLLDSDALRTNTAADSSDSPLSAVVARTVRHIAEIYEALPPCTALVVYSGSGDPRDLRALQALQKRFREEYKVKKWDELSVKWTDVEEQRLRSANQRARRGVGFLTVK
ncbi:EXOIII protein [Teratosphaeria destructans]|uniref:EXOIII protein n=1 Tax=Teratosphaeria destructans TaxID=418781 RepID=A0A9W7W0N0_9PEZI|nr:EXOIII protein [Teratosphaeria destructans]